MDQTIKRIISLEEDFMCNNTDDLLYGAMLVNATFQPIDQKLYISVNSFVKCKEFYQEITGKSWKTVKRHLETLMDKGLIELDDIYGNGGKTQAYILKQSDFKRFQYIDKEMLNYIVQTRNSSAVKIYIYLLNKYLWKQDYAFTKKELIRNALGLTGEHNCNYDRVNYILMSFAREGVIITEEYYEMITNEVYDTVPSPRLRLKFVAQKIDEF